MQSLAYQFYVFYIFKSIFVDISSNKWGRRFASRCYNSHRVCVALNCYSMCQRVGRFSALKWLHL